MLGNRAKGLFMSPKSFALHRAYNYCEVVCNKYKNSKDFPGMKDKTSHALPESIRVALLDIFANEPSKCHTGVLNSLYPYKG